MRPLAEAPDNFPAEPLRFGIDGPAGRLEAAAAQGPAPQGPPMQPEQAGPHTQPLPGVAMPHAQQQQGYVAQPQAPALPQRRAKVKALAPPEAVAAALTGLPNVIKVQPGPGGTVIVTYSGDDQSLAIVIRAIVMGGVAVAGVEPERNELERIFLEVTKGEVQ